MTMATPTIDQAPAAVVPRWRPSLATVSNYGIVFSWLALFVTLSFTSDVFLTKQNLLNILDQQAGLGVIAVGLTLVVIAGGFDLSVGAAFALAGVLGAKAAVSWGSTAGILVGLAVGVGIGLANGLLVTAARINSFIATLASSIIVRGAALAVTGGFLVTVRRDGFTTLGRGELLGLKYTVWLLLAVVLVASLLLGRTTFGRYIYASGSNAEAAAFSGIRVNRVRLATFAISGFTAGLAGMISVSRVATAQADSGTGLELVAIAAVVIGGTSISGGEGAVWRSFLGVTLLAMIGNGFNLMQIDPIYQEIFRGSLIVVAVGVDAWARRTRR